VIYAEKPHWTELPLRCLFGLHKFKPHPGIHFWKVCSVCNGEKEGVA
jgi:hypothetical protein